MLKNQICVVTPVVTAFIVDDDLQYQMKQKCAVSWRQQEETQQGFNQPARVIP